MTSVPFEMKHLYQIELKDIYKDVSVYREFLEGTQVDPRAYTRTILRGEDVLAIVVFYHLWKGVGEVSALVSPLVRKSPIAFHKMCLSLMDFAQEFFGLHRLQVYVRDGFREGQRWAERLGFEKECLMQKHGADGSNNFLYARLF